MALLQPKQILSKTRKTPTGTIKLVGATPRRKLRNGTTNKTPSGKGEDRYDFGKANRARIVFDYIIKKNLLPVLHIGFQCVTDYLYFVSLR